MIDPITSRLTVGHIREAYHAERQNHLGHIEIVRRLDRALEMLTRDERYTWKRAEPKTPLTLECTGPNGVYVVCEESRTCTCPDSQVLCKHRLAMKLILKALEYQKRDGLRVGGK